MSKPLVVIMIPLPLLIFTLIISGCQTVEPIGCNTIDEVALGTFSVTATNPSLVRQWIINNYSLAGASIKELTDVSNTHSFYWSLNQKYYHAAVDNDGAWFYFDWKGRKPNLKEVVSCFGKPESYDAHVIPPTDAGSITYFGIWYPLRRFVLIAYLPGSRLEVNNGTTFNTLSIPRPTFITTARYKPWPANLNDLKLDQ